mgnify:CR=1 FL=1
MLDVAMHIARIVDGPALSDRVGLHEHVLAEVSHAVAEDAGELSLGVIGLGGSRLSIALFSRSISVREPPAQRPGPR